MRSDQTFVDHQHKFRMSSPFYPGNCFQNLQELVAFLFSPINLSVPVKFAVKTYLQISERIHIFYILSIRFYFVPVSSKFKGNIVIVKKTKLGLFHRNSQIQASQENSNPFQISIQFSINLPRVRPRIYQSNIIGIYYHFHIFVNYFTNQSDV